MVSIIVPVYNAQAYLDQCVKSVLAQTYRDIQLILVNDGSSDGSGAHCDRLAAQDSRITVIHQENAGVSAARNAGLNAAKGEYIGFVDADDWIAPDAYEQALSAMDGCDIAMWDAVTVFDDGRTEPDTISLLNSDQILKKADWTPQLLQYMAGAVWRCLYRAELLEDIRFPVGIKLSEDRLFNLQAMGKAKTVGYLKRGMYYRTIQEGSACSRYHGDRFEKALLAANLAEAALKTWWDVSYIPGYRKKIIIGGALEAISEICGPNYPEKGRLAAIGRISDHPEVGKAFEICPAEGLREKLLKKRMNLALLVLERMR